MKQTELFIPKDTRELTLFSFGGGQDSWAILLMLIFEKEFRKKYAPNRLLIKMSDTGWEHPKTYDYVRHAQQLCKDFDIEFQFITPDLGFHPKSWQHLTYNWEKNDCIGSVAFPQTCTDNIKIQPIDNFVADYLYRNYDLKAKTKPGRFREFYYKYGKLYRIIGFTKDEEKRIKNRNKEPKWKTKSLGFLYPLIDIGANRADAQAIIKRYGFTVPPPSNCTICFYQSLQELLWLYRNLPDHLKHWIKLERNKRNKLNKSRAAGKPEEKNHGAYGKKRLIEKLREAIEKYGHWTDEELNEYKMSHGHCVRSKY